MKRVLVVIVFLGLIAGGIFGYIAYSSLFDPNTSFKDEEAYVFISSDASFSELSEQLSPLLEDLSSFERVAKAKGYNQNIKGGKYRIAKGMSNNDIINSLRSQNVPVKVSFNNQETLEALAGRISSQIEADSIELLKAFTDFDYLKSKGFNETNNLSPYIPNSYEFFWNTSAISFSDRMLNEYERFWTVDSLEKAKNSQLIPNEIIHMVSLVEKE